MRRTVLSFAVVLFQMLLVATIMFEIPILRGITTVVCFPAMILASMVAGDEKNNNKDFVITYETIALVVEAILWDTAIKNGGYWIFLFVISVIAVLYLLLYTLRRIS